jgi:hypothetical protein
MRCEWAERVPEYHTQVPTQEFGRDSDAVIGRYETTAFRHNRLPSRDRSAGESNRQRPRSPFGDRPIERRSEGQYGYGRVFTDIQLTAEKVGFTQASRLWASALGYCPTFLFSVISFQSRDGAGVFGVHYWCLGSPPTSTVALQQKFILGPLADLFSSRPARAKRTLVAEIRPRSARLPAPRHHRVLEIVICVRAAIGCTPCRIDIYGKGWSAGCPQHSAALPRASQRLLFGTICYLQVGPDSASKKHLGSSARKGVGVQVSPPSAPAKVSSVSSIDPGVEIRLLRCPGFIEHCCRTRLRSNVRKNSLARPLHHAPMFVQGPALVPD